MVITRASGSFVFVFLRVLTWGFLDTVLGEASCSTEEAWSLFAISWVLRPATDQVVIFRERLRWVTRMTSTRTALSC